MGGQWQRGLWMAAALALQFACGEDRGSASGAKQFDAAVAAQPDTSETLDAARSDTTNAGGRDGGADREPSDAMATTPQQREPVVSQTEFVSADFLRSSALAAVPSPAFWGVEGGPDEASDAAERRAIERGDVFRVLSDNRILNLNGYRGLQVLDVSDPSQPRVEGRLPVASSPFELYALGDRALVLLNDWIGYHGSKDDARIRVASGALVMSVDIQDRTNPKLIGQVGIEGAFLASRLTQGSDGRAMLYVAGNSSGATSHTFLRSFEVSTGELVAKSALEISEKAQVISASPELLMVASADHTKMVPTSTVTLVDISSSDGSMVKGGSVTTRGVVSNKLNMNAYQGVLRVVSGSEWKSTPHENQLETFSLSDLQNPTAIGSCQLTPRDPSGSNETLTTSAFIENCAFFVTSFRENPLHAVSIDAMGRCEERMSLVGAVGNTLLHPVLDNTRLLSLALDAESWRVGTLSLYDATNLDNPQPLLARADIEIDSSYTQANYDERGLSVLENAVSVRSADGTEETGLLLLPFVGRDDANQKLLARVQLFTFSSTTLSKRGFMDHGSGVRRSFGVQTDTTANLSDEAVSLFDTSNPDQPKELGRVDVAPSHSRVFKFGAHLARLHDNYGISSTPSEGILPQSKMEIVAAADEPETSPALAAFDVPVGATLLQVGQLLVSLLSDTTLDPNEAQARTTTQIKVWDLSDPTKPRARGTLTTDQLDPLEVAPVDRDDIDLSCSDCRWSSFGYVVGESIVFPSLKSQQRSIGIAERCETTAPSHCRLTAGNEEVCDNPYVRGGIVCITPKGGEESCAGGYALCDDTTDKCEETAAPPQTKRVCYDQEQFRYWASFSFHALDLRDPDRPALAQRVELPTDEEGSSLLAVGDKLFFSFTKPHQMPNDTRGYVKHYVRTLSFAEPQNAAVGEPINIPGDVIAAQDTTLYTRDLVWKDRDKRIQVVRVSLDGGQARLQATRLFENSLVSKVLWDGAGHILVSSAAANDPQAKNKLNILNDQDLSVLSETELETWADLRDTKPGLAIYDVPGGLLTLDARDAAKPKAQAYFPTDSWQKDLIFDGRSLVIAGAMYGVHRAEAGLSNLLAP